jgi:hypothetical protein
MGKHLFDIMNWRRMMEIFAFLVELEAHYVRRDTPAKKVEQCAVCAENVFLSLETGRIKTA